jgi:V/A-type H+-transporting ATPase subunit D
MAKKIKLTRPELKRQRDALTRFERYLPMLKLKQQQLQLTIRQVHQEQRRAAAALHEARARVAAYEAVLRDRAGLDVRGLAKPSEVRTGTVNVAGVTVPTFQDVAFPAAAYSLFATPPWVDRALADLRSRSRRQAEADVLDRQYRLLARELVKIIQRVNLFEKVMIPAAREAIRRIRIHLGDEMTAAVGRAKIAKGKLSADVSGLHMATAPAAGGPESAETGQEAPAP